MDPAPPRPIETNPASPPREPGFLGSRAFDLLMGLGVLLISVASLVIAVNANRTQDRMLAASVWPSLMFGTSNVSDDGKPQIALDLLNRGVGPARTRWAEVAYDGAPLRNLDDLRARCCTDPVSIESYSSGVQRRVLGADEWIQLVRVTREGVPEPLWRELEASLSKIRFRACYCSVLDDCWLLDSDTDEPEPMDRCPTAPAVLWGVRD
ncbi:hypothetical protein [Arenimonas sp. MALMAid1274]|uniref:hypothetical protein n=1 Tax=Arenimonas sp. MALMAid1274 TaxID=3411630 RepID=UPI003BA06E50